MASFGVATDWKQVVAEADAAVTDNAKFDVVFETVLGTTMAEWRLTQPHDATNAQLVTNKLDAMEAALQTQYETVKQWAQYAEDRGIKMSDEIKGTLETMRTAKEEFKKARPESERSLIQELAR